MFKSVGALIAGVIAMVAGLFGVVIDENDQVVLGGAVAAIAGGAAAIYQLYKAKKGVVPPSA